MSLGMKKKLKLTMMAARPSIKNNLGGRRGGGRVVRGEGREGEGEGAGSGQHLEGGQEAWMAWERWDTKEGRRWTPSALTAYNQQLSHTLKKPSCQLGTRLHNKAAQQLTRSPASDRPLTTATP
jgi:hypothetical protein